MNTYFKINCNEMERGKILKNLGSVELNFCCVHWEGENVQYFVAEDNEVFSKILDACSGMDLKVELMTENEFKKLDPLLTERQPKSFIHNLNLLPWMATYR